VLDVEGRQGTIVTRRQSSVLHAGHGRSLCNPTGRQLNVHPIRDWVSPRLDAMRADAVEAGVDRQTVVAVMTDIIARSA
jgi:hypothetical protein